MLLLMISDDGRGLESEPPFGAGSFVETEGLSDFGAMAKTGMAGLGNPGTGLEPSCKESLGIAGFFPLGRLVGVAAGSLADADVSNVTSGAGPVRARPPRFKARGGILALPVAGVRGEAPLECECECEAEAGAGSEVSEESPFPSAKGGTPAVLARWWPLVPLLLLLPFEGGAGVEEEDEASFFFPTLMRCGD